jgi:hypothetical protein
MAKKDETTMTMSVNGGPESAPFTGKDMDRLGRKLGVDLDQHDRLLREDETLGAYIRLEAEKAATMADYNERLKALWEEVQACYREVHDPQRGLPLESSK